MSKIRFIDGTELSASAVYSSRGQIRSEDRDVIIMELIETDYTAAAALFIDGAQFAVVYEEMSKVYDGLGVFTGKYDTSETVHENYDYIVAGDITDHRDGSVTVIMGKKTRAEELADANIELVSANDEMSMALKILGVE